MSRRFGRIEERYGTTLHWLPTGKLPGFLSYWTSFRSSIHNLLRQIQPDLAHFHGAAGWTLGYDAPYVLTIHGIAERDMSFQHGPLVGVRKVIIALVERAGRRRSPNTIVISPYVLEQVGTQIGGKQHFIENPVDVKVFDVRRVPQNKQVLYVGRINRRKNVEGLIEAFALVHQAFPDATLRIAGVAEDNTYLEHCRRLVRSNRIESAVHFLGGIDRATLLEELSHAACLALVAKQETAPIIVEEAMAAGVPVVASRVCGLPYLVENGKTGFLVNPNSKQEIAQAFRQMLSNNARVTEAMGERARELALRRFHPYAVAEQTLAVYRGMLSTSTATLAGEISPLILSP